MTDGAGIKSVAYGNVIGLLIEAIKELDDKVNSLQKQLDEKNNDTTTN
jgi:tetrahydromethanopterin S-methyltransferase subunit B